MGSDISTVDINLNWNVPEKSNLNADLTYGDSSHTEMVKKLPLDFMTYDEPRKDCFGIFDIGLDDSFVVELSSYPRTLSQCKGK